MDTFHDFVIDAVIKENNKILGLALYPLYGGSDFRSIRLIMKGPSLNSFLFAPDRLMLRMSNLPDDLQQIVIGNISDDGIITIQNLPTPFQKKFNELPNYTAQKNDAV